MAVRITLPQTSEEVDPYTEENARSRIMRVGTKRHSHFVEIYSDGQGDPLVNEVFRLYGMEVISRGMRPGAENAGG